jgi:hypothetical protein
MGEPFVYHRVGENMQGSILYPLNQLKEIYPDIYAEHLKKYEGREHVLETRIPPPLDCLWNDVLHFTAVHPRTLFTNLEKAGFDAAALTWKQWFKIPIRLFDPAHTIVCLYRRDLRIVPDARDFTAFDMARMTEYQTVPQETLDYYKEQRALGERPLFFHRVPHILFKGTVDVSGIEIIEI